MTNFLMSVLGDMFNLVGASLPTATLSQFIKKRKEILTDVILSEIRAGDFSRMHDDDKLSIVYKLAQSAIEGVAKNNLRLMCRVINGMGNKNVSEASVFLRYAKILADLSEDEIRVLGIMAKHHPTRTEEEIHYRDAEIKEMFGSKIESIQSALTRTGLVTLYIGAKGVENPGMNFGGMVIPETIKYYFLSPLMDEITEYTDFIIQKENDL